ncbi:MAG: NAD-dependent epimerase/dehydratase family protein, partial [Acidobacteriota bacterium]|nr:NAD-dependent epimerase/dehydratase family protein [Acidobacteriota bacterium]
MKVIVTGSTGLVGRALVRSLLSDGREVTRLVRGGAQEFRAPGTKAVQWGPEKGAVSAAELEGHDAAVHLAGDPIAEGRWDDEKKRRIRESRVKGTRLLAETLAGLSVKPRVLVSASATGFYGDRGEEVLYEESASGEDFLSEVCREWEKATMAASQAGIRVVHLRIGFVLSAEGGGLPKMLTPFKLGVGG